MKISYINYLQVQIYIFFFFFFEHFWMSTWVSLKNATICLKLLRLPHSLSRTGTGDSQKSCLSSSNEGESCDRCWVVILSLPQVYLSVVPASSLLNMRCPNLLGPALSLKILTCSFLLSWW